MSLRPDLLWSLPSFQCHFLLLSSFSHCSHTGLLAVLQHPKYVPISESALTSLPGVIFLYLMARSFPSFWFPLKYALIIDAFSDSSVTYKKNTPSSTCHSLTPCLALLLFYSTNDHLTIICPPLECKLYESRNIICFDHWCTPITQNIISLISYFISSKTCIFTHFNIYKLGVHLIICNIFLLHVTVVYITINILDSMKYNIGIQNIFWIINKSHLLYLQKCGAQNLGQKATELQFSIQHKLLILNVYLIYTKIGIREKID